MKFPGNSFIPSHDGTLPRHGNAPPSATNNQVSPQIGILFSSRLYPSASGMIIRGEAILASKTREAGMDSAGVPTCLSMNILAPVVERTSSCSLPPGPPRSHVPTAAPGSCGGSCQPSPLTEGRPRFLLAPQAVVQRPGQYRPAHAPGANALSADRILLGKQTKFVGRE